MKTWSRRRMADLHKSRFARLACSTASSDVFCFFFKDEKIPWWWCWYCCKLYKYQIEWVVLLTSFWRRSKTRLLSSFKLSLILARRIFSIKGFFACNGKKRTFRNKCNKFARLQERWRKKNVTFLNRKFHAYLSSFRQNLANINGTVDAFNGHVCVELRMSFSGKVSVSEMLTRWACVSNCPTCMMPPIYIHQSWENIGVVCRH